MNILLQYIAQVTIPTRDPNGVQVIPTINLDVTTMAGILNAVFMLIGGLTVLFLLIGAIRYVTSNGEQNMIKQAKDTILYSIIGLVITMSAFAIVQFVAGQLSR